MSLNEFVLPDGFETFDMQEISEFELNESEELVLIRLPKQMNVGLLENLKLDLKKQQNINSEFELIPAIGDSRGEMKNVTLLKHTKDGAAENIKIPSTYLVQPIINLDYEKTLLDVGNMAKNTKQERRPQLKGMKIQSTPNGFDTSKSSLIGGSALKETLKRYTSSIPLAPVKKPKRNKNG